MSGVNGTLEAASNALLGAPGTTYPGAFSARGLEGTPDGYTISGNTVTVSMNVAQPGDWIRVVTQATAEDCKKGGWQTSPLHFKNQGDCVSYIATYGKNEPGRTSPGTELAVGSLRLTVLQTRSSSRRMLRDRRQLGAP